ncbi:MAG: flagellar basal body P-ring formation protein FlgA [Candidatus Hydrogenedentes bacterium]|nr:flagellar basal body P-ring formation protein FlgA [Candidatus Hydrogenedentota bacterium]
MTSARESGLTQGLSKAGGAAHWGAASRAFAMLLLGLLAMPLGAEDRVVLKEVVAVKGPLLRLGDLATIESPDALALAEVEVGAAAVPGSYKNVNLSLVEASLRNAGIEGREFKFEGAAQVRAETLSLELSREMITASLRSFIEQEMPWDASEAEVEIPMVLQNVVVPDGVHDIRWKANPQYEYLGTGSFQGVIVVDGVEQKHLMARATIEAYGNVLVAATDIPRGRPISAGDLEMKKHPLSNAPANAFTDMKDAIGLVAKKTIFPGQVLTERNVEARLVVKRNQIVPVEMRVGGVNIQTSAKALMDGRANDVIVCANPSSKEEFQGLVRDDGTVVVQ